MEINREKQITAAISAVMAYLEYEQAAGMSVLEEEAAYEPAAAVRPWGTSGRQAQMQNRILMQMRAFK